MAKSDKLYSHSPSVKKDADGKAKLDKPSKTMMDSTGLGGNPLPPDGAAEMPLHVKQYADMHERHHTELKDMHKRHQKEYEKLAADHMGTDAAGESVTARAGVEGVM